MVMKYALTGKDGIVMRPSMIHVMNGMSPFLVLGMCKDKVAQLNDKEDLSLSASMVIVADL